MTTILDVIEKEPKGTHPWWVIVDATGTKHATKNMFLAALAQRCREKETRVEIGSSAGWYYRELYALKPEGQEASVA